MIFETYPQWEIDNPVLKALAIHNARRYRAIHVTPEVEFYVVELCVRFDETGEEDVTSWETYFLNDLDDVFNFIGHYRVVNSRINLFVPRKSNDNDEYGIYEIKKIYTGKDKQKRNFKIFLFKNGKSFTIPSLLKSNKLKDKKCIYPRS